MPTFVGGEEPLENTAAETEYGGTQPLPNAVQALGPSNGETTRNLENHEKLRLGYLTGQEEDPMAPRETGFMGGVDSNFPEHPELEDFVPADYRSTDYLE